MRLLTFCTAIIATALVACESSAKTGSYPGSSEAVPDTIVVSVEPYDPRGEVQGHFTNKNHRFEPTHVYAFRMKNSIFGEQTHLVFVGSPLDIGLLYVTSPVRSATEATIEMGLELRIRDKESGAFALWGDNVNLHGGPYKEVTIEENSEQRVAGKWIGTEFDFDFNLHFDAIIADPIAHAKPLPTGGGRPGRAFLEFLKNVREGENVDELRRFLNSKHVLKEGANEEEIRDDLEYLRNSRPVEVKIAGGWVDRQGAIFDGLATKSNGDQKKLRVTLQRSDKGWKLYDMTYIE